MNIRLGFLLAAISAMGWFSGFAEVPGPVTKLVAEMQETGATVRGGVDSKLGVFIVAIGHSRYREDDVNFSREIAELNAKKQLGAALGEAFRAKDTVALKMSVDGDGNAEASAFVSSLSDASISQYLKGLQMVSSRKNAGGEMEVVMYMSSRSQDMAGELAASQMKWGDKGVVRAVGIDTARMVAEKNALRSAVEQVAGTMVVGKVAVNEKEEMHKRLATTAGALVEEYRVVNESKVDVEFRVEVLAKVDKRKLYDSYRSYFKCLDNPTFFLVATDEALLHHFRQFFVDKGFTIVNRPEDCHYVIKLNGRFHERPTPSNPKSMGTMLNLEIEIATVDGSRTLLTMSERQSKDSEVLSEELRHEEVSRRIFNKMEQNLHQAIHNMVVRMLDDSDTQTGTTVSSSGTAF